jgi:hypothetical protein
MHAMGRLSGRTLLGIVMAGCIAASLPSAAAAKAGDRTNLNVVVTDAETGKPINQAKLTLFFREPRPQWKKTKTISFSAKTNVEGHCRFALIPKGSVRLMVTAERHGSFGKDFDVHEDDQVIEVKLKKPQPLL